MRSVMSRVTLANPMISPVSFGIGSITTEAQKQVPSLRTRHLRLELSFTGCGSKRARWNSGRAVLLGIEAAEVLANDLVGSVVLDAFGTGVPGRYDAILVQLKHRIVNDRLHHARERHR
jgi:hypothetical protein